MTRHSSKAFTLIELSAVIVIIGILIAGLMETTGLVKKSKIAVAQNLAKASAIAVITNNALWLESIFESSFKDTESSTITALISVGGGGNGKGKLPSSGGIGIVIMRYIN